MFDIPNNEPASNFEIQKSRALWKASIFFGAAFLGLTFLWGVLCFMNTHHVAFPTNRDVTIEEGSTISDVAHQFASEKLVRNNFLFYLTLETLFRNTSIKAGVYRFSEPVTMLKVADAITNGTSVSPPLIITFPEGFRVSRMQDYLPDSFQSEDITPYITLEGYLFPDTYFIHSNTTLDELVQLMNETFSEKTMRLWNEYPDHTLSPADTVILASIIEREANDVDSMRVVAGILINRLSIGMPLQTDATLDYLTGKTSAELTREDLLIDSPYNTYQYQGLPPTPISNPGLTALRAVLDPVHTEYLYYLTGNDGKFYYAKSFDEHKKNKLRYLR